MTSGKSGGWIYAGRLFAGVALLAATLILPPPPGLSPEGWRTAGVALLMAVWWITEALPLPATALAPLVLFPLLGIASFSASATPFADPVIFLFLGGFLVGASVQRWALHERIGLRIVATAGCSPRGLVAGFLVATAFLSMWVSNSATAMMMVPVAGAVLPLVAGKRGDEHDETRGAALMLAVAYGASIGGLGTLVGTPPNALLAAYMERQHGVQIGFAQWMALGVPVSCAMLGITWLTLTKLYPVPTAPEASVAIARRRAALGPMSAAEIRVSIIFIATIAAWVLRPLYSKLAPAVDDSLIAIAAALVLFVTPSGMEGRQQRLLTWEAASSLPWGVLVLFGGGLSLAAAIGSSGLAAWLATNLHALSGFHPLYIVAAATLAMIFLTEITSNTASAAAFLPLGGALAVASGLDPILLTAPLALAASCAFMLPVATPPNANVFASGAVTIAQMARAGLWLNLTGAAIITMVSYLLAARLFGS